MCASKRYVDPLVNITFIDADERRPDHKQMVDKTPFQHRFDRMLTHLGLPSLSAFADHLGVTKQVVNNWYNRDGRIGAGKRTDFQRMTGISWDWVNDGTGAMLLAQSASDSVAATETPPGYVRFQLLNGDGGMGEGIVNTDYPEVIKEVDIAEWEVRRKIGYIPSAGRIRLMTGRGASMRPMIDNGDVVLVDTATDRFDGDGVYVININGETQIKMLQMRGDGLYVVSANTDYPAYKVDAESVYVGGRVVSVLGMKSM